MATARHGIGNSGRRLRTAGASRTSASGFRFTRTLTGTVLLVLGAACTTSNPDPDQSTARSTTRQIAGSTMGTSYAVIVPDGPTVILPGIEDEIGNLLDEIEESLSTWIPTSVISRVNQADRDVWNVTDPHFVRVFERATEIHAETSAFNPAIGPLVDLWGFGPVEPPELPDSDSVEALRELVDMGLFETRGSPPEIRKRRAGARLDFSGIAKGYAVDELASLLDRNGHTAYFIEIGGEIRTRGRHPEGRQWRIAIEFPGTRGLVAEVGDVAIATSGSQRNYQILDGRRLPHILNPHTGYPEPSSVFSVSVVAPDTMTADAYATALMVLGPEAGLALVERMTEVEAAFIIGNGSEEDAAHILERTAGFPDTHPAP